MCVSVHSVWEIAVVNVWTTTNAVKEAQVGWLVESSDERGSGSRGYVAICVNITSLRAAFAAVETQGQTKR